MYFPRENRPKMCPILTVLPGSFLFVCLFVLFCFFGFFLFCFVFCLFLFCFVLFCFCSCFCFLLFFLLLNDSPFRREIFHRMTPRFKFLSKHSVNSKDECRPRETIWSSVGATESPSHEQSLEWVWHYCIMRRTISRRHIWRWRRSRYHLSKTSVESVDKIFDNGASKDITYQNQWKNTYLVDMNTLILLV